MYATFLRSLGWYATESYATFFFLINALHHDDISYKVVPMQNVNTPSSQETRCGSFSTNLRRSQATMNDMNKQVTCAVQPHLPYLGTACQSLIAKWPWWTKPSIGLLTGSDVGPIKRSCHQKFRPEFWYFLTIARHPWFPILRKPRCGRDNLSAEPLQKHLKVGWSSMNKWGFN